MISRKLAQYNGIKNPELIRVNQVIEIPSRRELLGGLRPTLTAPASGLTPPNGLPEILATFGDIYSFIRDDGSLDPRWETEYMAYTHLPFPMPLSWDLSKSVTNLYGHKKLTELLSNVFAEIERRALRTKVRTYGVATTFARSARAASFQRTVGELPSILTQTPIPKAVPGTWTRRWSKSFANLASNGAETGPEGLKTRCISSSAQVTERIDLNCSELKVIPVFL